MTLAVNLAQGASNNVTFRNKLINGAMVIDQRYAGTATANTINAYTLDRWYALQTTTGKIIVQQNAGSVTPPTGYTYYLGATSQSAYTVGAGDVYAIFQRIEGYNIADLAWGTASAATVTFSFWVRSSLTGTFSGTLQNNAQTRAYPFTYTISSANTWEQKSVTITGETSGAWLTTNGSGLQVGFSLGAGSTYSGTANAWNNGNIWAATGATSVVGTSGATFYITGVQLEAGTTASPFEYRQYGTEFSLCQRYFQKCDSFFGAGNTSTNWVGIMTLQQTMRTTPSIGQTGVVYVSDFTAIDTVQSSASASVINTGGGGTALCCYLFNYSGLTAGKFYGGNRAINSNTVTFSAEL